MLSLSCTDDNSLIPQVENGNFSIYVSNQSSTLDPVDINVYIDGKPAIKQEFYWLNGSNHLIFQFQLDGEEHRLSATSVNGNISKDTTFNLTITPYSYISFWYEPAHDQYDEYKNLSVKFFQKAPVFM